ncbi:MAG TPA: sulfatase-like hydrolase/transferase [Vicinamibacterales bacterium]|nr:sulfatase-like hydrolase/transferase [Vicinamibacterales bacterium]
MRRPLVSWGAVGALALAIIVAALLWWPRARPFVLEPQADQNVLLVTIDTLRADALSSYGGPAQTPNLDRLAAHGTRFTFAHSHAVVTLPSHTTILTGRYPYEHGMRDNSGFRVKEGTATLATRLKAIGFSTGAFVGGFPLTKRFGLTPGFDAYDDQMPEMDVATSVSMPERRADLVVSRAGDWIGRQAGQFFAWVHVFDPHSPYTPPDEYRATYPTQPYYGEVAWVDHALGPLFDRLATLSRPTLVIVTADHGESLGDHGELTHGMFAYEATLRVPLIIARVAGTTASRASRSRGVVIDTPVRQIDIAPTVLDAVGGAADDSLPGSSLRDVIRAGQGADRPAYFESMTYNLVRGWAPLRGVLAGKNKFIDLPIPELYDLAADPQEARNHAAEQPDRAQVMANLLRGYNVAPPARPGPEPVEVTAALRSLGYVTGSAPARQTYTEADDPKRLVKVDQDLHTASELYRSGRVQDAIAMLDSVITRRPDTADAYIQLAYAYWEAGEPRAAIATLEKALANGAPDRDVRIRLGIYLAESRTDSARAIKVLETLPTDDVEALNGLGVAYGGAGRHADAIRIFKRVLALDPTNGLAYQNLASIVLKEARAARNPSDRARGLKEAEVLARQALDADPDLAKAYTTLGVILAETGRKSDAIESWKRAVALDGSEFDALYNLTILLVEAGRLNEAREYAQRFVATAPPALYRADIDQMRRYLSGG